MPTYQYACTDCGDQLEAVQSFSDPALTECPACQGKLRKVFNSVGIVFKGSGFYRNDSRPADKGTEKANAAPTETKSDSTPKSDTKSETTSSTSTSTSKDSSSSSANSAGSSGGAKAAAASS